MIYQFYFSQIVKDPVLISSPILFGKSVVGKILHIEPSLFGKDTIITTHLSPLMLDIRSEVRLKLYCYTKQEEVSWKVMFEVKEEK